MDRLVPRHHRKAGSGPPANALIAWIGTDPYLREAAATASYQREIALPLSSRSRSAKMAVAVCFVLACGAVLGITTIISHGRGAAIVISSAAPGSVTASAPAGMAPMQADGATAGHADCGAPSNPGAKKSDKTGETDITDDSHVINPGQLTYPGGGAVSIEQDKTGAGRLGDPGTDEQSASACQPPF